MAGQLNNHPIDSREFKYGEIYLVKDEEVHFPESKHTSSRTFHGKRMVCIIHHCLSNLNKYIWTTNAAPFSTQLHMKRDTDLEVTPQPGNYINRTSLIRLGAAQPFLKIDLEGPVGQLTTEQLQELAYLQVALAGIDLSDSDEEDEVADVVR
ncbi:hydrogenase [Alicyclobacillus tolerans]|uniref:hydrogenase n=1 Tax=Alicyclobacillus tolerans TaxID=90970 RepID=UPI001F3A727C|nr:hydrogenase [Alicyclobacillus tolerans]MCF8567810.1 hydrogenase [Alicyclobacillus tolerans]